RVEIDAPGLGEGRSVARPAELPAELMAALERGAVQRVQPLREQRVSRLLERQAAPGIALVRLLDRHRAIGDRAVAGVHLKRRLQASERRLLGPRLVTEQAVEREVEEVAQPP